jgi:putative ABC transport system substrate-binding protein
MDRRCFLLTSMAGALAAPLVAGAQQAGKVYRIGVLHVGDHIPPGLHTLRDTLKALGYEAGKNLQLDFRNVAEEESASLSAREFVVAGVDVLVAFGDPAVLAAKIATARIPIVMVHSVDPVGQGFVKSLSRPAGNLTGFIYFAVSPAKQVQLFKEMVPSLHHILVPVDPRDPATPAQLAEIRTAAKALNLTLIEREATDQAALEYVFRSLKQGDIDGVVPASTTLHIKFTALLIRLASDKRVPLASYRREAVEHGALFSYAPDAGLVGQRAATYVDKILKGAKPAELPFQQPTTFDLVINLKTAKALGLTIPPALLARADQVIE